MELYSPNGLSVDIFNGFGNTVRGPCRNPETGCCLFHSLVVMCVGEKLCLPRNLSYCGALQEMDCVGGHTAWLFLIMPYRSVRVLCRYVLIECPAECHIYQLLAPADA